MSPDRQFDVVWPDLRATLKPRLRARGVPVDNVEDVLQETAIRLYRAWETIDPARPILPFAITVALNVWRDEIRRVGRREFVAEIPEAADPYDLERTILARLEVQRVGAALGQLSAPDREAILSSDVPRVTPLAPAQRMRLMRARRELVALLAQAGAAVGVFRLGGKASGGHRTLKAALACSGTAAVAVAGLGVLSPAQVTPATPVIAAPRAAVVVARAVTHHVAAPAHVAVARRSRPHVARTAKPAVAATCSGSSGSSAPPPTQSAGPLSVTVLTKDVLLDVHDAVTGTRVHSSSDGCTSVTGPTLR